MAEQSTLTSPLQTGFLHRFNLSLGTTTADDVLDLSQDYNLDVWHATQEYVDIYTTTSDATNELPPTLLSLPYHTTVIRDTPPTIHLTPWNLSSLQNTTFHESYHPLFEVDRFIHEIVSMYPDVASTVPLGHSALGREMWGLKLHRENALANGNREIDPSHKLGFVIMGTLHAREWVATAASLYLVHALVSDTSEPHSITSLLDTYDFYIVPSPNPDGYAYTWESDRFWYKNRQIMGPSERCVGLDLNRNWGYKWKARSPDNYSPTSHEDSTVEDDFNLSKAKKPKKPIDPCSHWFPGHRAFESPENNNLANYITTLPNLVAFVDLRSYGQMMSAPYSFSCKRVAKDAEDQIEAAHGAMYALRQAHGTSFVTGRLCETLYPAPGNMIDWMYARAGIKYSYAVHLRDTGTYGFSLPPEWIRPVGEETANLVDYLARFIAKQLKRL